jgi:hypothetical protein
MTEKQELNAVIRENRLDFLQMLYDGGAELSVSDIQLLIKYKRITLSKERQEILNEENAQELLEEENKEIQEKIEDRDSIPFDLFGESDRFGGNFETISKQDWLPKSITEHEDDFILWIDSMNRGFQQMSKYDKFRMYCEQSKRWIDEKGSIGKFLTHDQKRQYALQEFNRCKENTLYFLDKYLVLKEGDASSGERSYESKPAHKAICYLFDCGYSFMLGKPRQIAATSTLGGCALQRIIFNRNFFLKFITMDKESGVEIFEDKIKFPFGELPEWMKPEVSNDRDNLFRLSKKTGKKGTKGGVNSKLQVVAPSVSAINGGSPQLVMIDEAGYIGILSKMMKEARPTMFWQNPETGVLEMKRQIIIWGTGGEMDKGGKAYENEFMDGVNKWKERDFSVGIIPIFFDWTTRPGITRKKYLEEKRAYTVKGPESEALMTQFRQHYPSVLEDMFLTSNKLLVSISWINEQREKILKLNPLLKPKKGRFEPIFNTANPTDENSDVPFEIIGAEFIPYDDTRDEMSNAPITMFLEPNKSWRNRYFQGTDPIMSDNGYSNMASVVWDNHFRTPVCMMNYRDDNHKYTFMQTLLMGIYYNTNPNDKAVPELVEANIGQAYSNYKDSKGFGRSLVYRTELPPAFQGGQNIVGIDNRSTRTKLLIEKMSEAIRVYGENIYIDEVFQQLRTFVCTINSTTGHESWGTVDKKSFHDDVLFALVFSYICSLVYEQSHPPKEILSETDKYKYIYKLVRDGDGKLTRKREKVEVKY